MPPTSTDSSVFIRILRDTYGYTETMLHYTEEGPRIDMYRPIHGGRLRMCGIAYRRTRVSTLFNGTEASGLGYAAGNEAYGNVFLASSDSYGQKCAKAAMRFGKIATILIFPWILIMVRNILINLSTDSY